MHKPLGIPVLLLALLLLPVFSAQSAHITIIESQSFDPNHTMDAQWQAVATGLGHTAVIVPQSTLDDGTFIPTTDMLIVSSGTIPLPSPRYEYIYEALYAGRAVYLQTEHNPALGSNWSWEWVVEFAGAAWSWQSTLTGALAPVEVSGALSAMDNGEHWVQPFTDACTATYAGGDFDPNLHYQADAVGWFFDPPQDFAGKMGTSTDQDWIINNANPDLMENYITTLLANVRKDLDIRIWPVNPPVTIPAAGSMFSHYAQVANLVATSNTFDAWLRVVTPAGNLFGPLQNFPGVTMMPSAISPQFTLNQFVPAAAPPGTYTLQGIVGDMGTGVIVDADNFDFDKVLIAGPDGEPVTEWRGEGIEQFAQLMSGTRAERAASPAEFQLSSAQPNPFNPSTTVSLTLPAATTLAVTVHDITGRQVAELHSGPAQPGEHRFQFDAYGLATGIYFARATAEGHGSQVRKLMLVK